MGIVGSLLETQLPSNMKFQLVVLTLIAVFAELSLSAGTTSRPTCPEITCPNAKPEGGMFKREACGPEFCDCSYGVPYLLHCEEHLVFDEENQICNWCYNMCDDCNVSCDN